MSDLIASHRTYNPGEVCLVDLTGSRAVGDSVDWTTGGRKYTGVIIDRNNSGLIIVSVDPEPDLVVKGD